MTAPKHAPALLDLVTDPATNRLSTTRVCRLAACAVASVMFVRAGWTTPLSAEVWLYYLGVLCADAAASKLISARYGARTYDNGGAYPSAYYARGTGAFERPLPGGDLPPTPTRGAR